MTLYTGDNFLFEEIRLDTFPEHVSERDELARRGFIYVEGDYKCCFCPNRNNSHTNNEPGGGEDEHHQHEPTLGLGNISIDYKNQLHPPSFLYGYVPLHCDSKNVGFACIRYHIQPSYVDYARLEKLLDSFVSRTPGARGLTEAGFFSTGNGLTCCYHCGLVLRRSLDETHLLVFGMLSHPAGENLDYVSRQTVFTPYVPDPPKMALLGRMVQSLMLPKKLIEEMNYSPNEVCKAYLNYCIKSNGLFPSRVQDALSAVTMTTMTPPPEKEEGGGRGEEGESSLVKEEEEEEEMEGRPIITHTKNAEFLGKECICCRVRSCQIVHFPCGHILCCSWCTLLLKYCPYCTTSIVATCHISGM